MPTVKAYIAILLSLLAGAIAGGFVTYQPTRDKWNDLGRETGLVQGRAEVLAGLCDLAIKGPPPGQVEYSIDVKASRLSAVKDGDGVRLYCQE